ncbi:MAG: radical SAM protein [Candidatus Adiutrix sp.]|nr:radical SAM protein [Candidatus Adiutrix sp.]
MGFKQLHREPGGQVALYQSGDRYFSLLEKRFGRRFLDYRRRWAETSGRGRPGDFPLSLDLAINSGCQLHCLMCPLPGRPGSRRVRLMADSLYERLMSQAREHQLPALTLGLGSEPLLHPRAAELAAEAVRAGIMDIRLGSNGAKLDDDSSRALIDSGLTRLEISLDAARPGTYRAVRGGNLEKLERSLDRFLELRQKAGLETPLLRLSFLKLDLNRGQLELFLKKWADKADLLAIQEAIWFPGSRLPRPSRPARPLAPVCGQSWQRLAVNHDGSLWPCCSWYGEGLLPFNAADISLASVWQSPAMNQLRRSLSGPASGYPPPCSGCEY